jgi:hypothetical protein
MPACIICGRDAGQGSESFTLTEEEVAALKAVGEKPHEAYVYCKACLRVMKDPEAGPQFLKGFWLSKLRAAGVPNADRLAQKLYEFLRSKTKKLS